MFDKRKNALKVALLGMDGRTYKTLAMYLQGPCKTSFVTIVDEEEAEAVIIDADLPAGRTLLANIEDEKSKRPWLVLSLHEIKIDGVLYLQKPVKTEAMQSALAQARERVQTRAVKVARREAQLQVTADQTETISVATETDSETEPSLKHYSVDLSERQKTSKHRTAMLMDEKGFTALMGSLKALDATNRQSLLAAVYNPKEYFQGYVQSAFKVACARGQVLQLNSSWKQMLIFPHSGEVWLDADDKQLRAFAGIAINRNGNQKMSLAPLTSNSAINEVSDKYPTVEIALKALDKFQTMEGMLWKLTCWTSKGRYPAALDIERPLYLKHWPNFTRLLVTPHAMRIAALLIDKPRSAINIAKELDIKIEYVFVFISAASAVGLLGQAVRNADNEVMPPELKPVKKQGMLRRIINKLRTIQGI